MSSKTIIHPKKFVRAITDLSSSSQMLDPESILEISRDGKSYRTNLAAIDAEIIDEFPLYTNLNDIFNSLKHHNQTYFNPGNKYNNKTTFLFNPYVHEPTDSSKYYYDLSACQLITKSKIQEYIDKIGFCVPAHKPDSEYIYYDADGYRWKMDSSKTPKVIDFHKDGIWTSNSKAKFRYGNNRYFYTDEIKAEKNMMLDVTGNIVLNVAYSDDWYENQHYFVALTIAGKVITLEFLKNILKLDKYTIAQFHFHYPIADETLFRIITNAPCKLFGLPVADPFPRKLYNSLNAVNLSYYDIGSTALFKPDTFEPEEDDDDPEQEYISKTVKKQWEGDREDTRPDRLSMTLTADGADKDAVYLTSPSWETTINNLPKYQNDFTTEIDYDWVEGSMPEGYTLKSKVQVDDTTTFTNKYTEPEPPPVETVDVTIQKVWHNDDDPDKPESLDVVLLGDNVEIERKTLSGPNWTYTRTELPKYRENTEIPIEYTWDEDLPENYSSDGGTTVNNTTTVINTYIEPEPPEFIDLTVIKVWDDSENNLNRLSSVSVTLYGDNEEIDSVILSESNNWQATIEHQPIWDANEDEINYVWVEEELPRVYESTHETTYETTVRTTTITNTYVDPYKPKITLTNIAVTENASFTSILSEAFETGNVTIEQPSTGAIATAYGTKTTIAHLDISNLLNYGFKDGPVNVIQGDHSAQSGCSIAGGAGKLLITRTALPSVGVRAYPLTNSSSSGRREDYYISGGNPFVIGESVHLTQPTFPRWYPDAPAMKEDDARVVEIVNQNIVTLEKTTHAALECTDTLDFYLARSSDGPVESLYIFAWGCTDDNGHLTHVIINPEYELSSNVHDGDTVWLLCNSSVYMYRAMATIHITQV